MNTTTSSIEGMHRAQALLGFAATRIAKPETATDVVSLSEAVLDLIQAKISMSASVTAFHADMDMEKTLMDVLG